MALIELKLHPGRRELRQLGLLVLPLVTGALAALAFFRWHQPTAAIGFASVGAAGLLLGAVAPTALKPLSVGLSIATWPIGWVISLVALALVYFLVLSPIAAIMRLRRMDPMARRFDRNTPSYWIDRRRKPDPQRYFRQF